MTRRSLLIYGGAGVGLVVGYELWPRRYAPPLDALPGEHHLSSFVRIGEDGHVTIVVPQVELGHGVFTTMAQIVADELGADWRTVGVETARPGPLYANTLFAREWEAGLGSALPAGLIDAAATRQSVMATGGSGSVRAFEARLRDAGAAARALLCLAAAARWDADWQACDTHDGFVWRGDDKVRFGEVAAVAATHSVPSNVAWRTGREHRLTGVVVPRLDLPAKVDGSVTYAGDVRLPDMVYASIAEGPAGDTRVKAVDRAAALRVAGVLDLVQTERWVAVVASNWWAANNGLDAARPRFTVTGDVAGTRRMSKALDDALLDGGTRMSASGDIDDAFRGAQIFVQSYHVGLAPHAPVETASVTANLEHGTLHVWAPVQLPDLATRAAARALDMPVADVVLHPMQVGGSFGARYEIDIVVQAAILADRMKRPVQLVRSRAEETRRDPFRPAAAAKMAARVGPDGRIGAWFARIASPATAHEMQGRIVDGQSAYQAMHGAQGISEPAAIAGALTPYDIPIHAIDHHPARLGIPTGDWRGRAYGSNCFFAECFVDEISHMTGTDPFSARMTMLGTAPRLAQCLTRVAIRGNWLGGAAGSNQGLAVHAMADSFIAVMAEAHLEGGQVRVDRLVAVADVGRVINPDVVRAQIIGGLVFGMSTAVGVPVEVTRGIAGPARLGVLRLPRVADCPAIDVELIASAAAPGGAGELAVPPVAPAIAGALFAATGRRFRELPMVVA